MQELQKKRAECKYLTGRGGVGLENCSRPAGGHAKLSQMSVYVNGFEISFSLSALAPKQKQKKKKMNK